MTYLSEGSDWNFELLADYDKAIADIAHNKYGLDASFKPSELVVREILCIASAVMDETFLSDFSSPDSETEDPIS